MRLNPPCLPEMLESLGTDFKNQMMRAKEEETDILEKSIADVWEEEEDFSRISFAKVVFKNCHFTSDKGWW